MTATPEFILRQICGVLICDKDDWSADTLDQIAEILSFYDWLDFSGDDVKLNEIRTQQQQEEGSEDA